MFRSHIASYICCTIHHILRILRNMMCCSPNLVITILRHGNKYWFGRPLSDASKKYTTSKNVDAAGQKYCPPEIPSSCAPSSIGRPMQLRNHLCRVLSCGPNHTIILNGYTQLPFFSCTIQVASQIKSVLLPLILICVHDGHSCSTTQIDERIERPWSLQKQNVGQVQKL
jgi:hypothetical protein